MVSNFTEKISVIVDIATDKATRGIKNLKSAVGDAEGATGKLRAGASFLAIGLGGALATAGLKGADSLTVLAKSSLDLAKSTGMSTEEASRWIAVADDAGLSAETLQSSVGKIAKTLDSGKWEKYGIATHDASGEARSANSILLDSLSTLSAITNQTERARVGNDLFSKGWQNLAPLVGHTKDEYQKMLATVSDGQVITDDEAAKAEKLRLAQDNLKDSLRDVTMTLGSLVAESAPFIDFLSRGVEYAARLAGIVSGNDKKSLTGSVKTFHEAVAGLNNDTDGIVGVLNAFADLKQSAGDSRSSLDQAGRTFDLLTMQTSDAEQNLANVRLAFDQLSKDSPDDAKLVANALLQLANAADAGNTHAAERLRKWGLTRDIIAEMASILPAAKSSVTEFGDANKVAAQKAGELAAAEAKTADETITLDEAMSSLLGRLDQQDAWDNVLQKVWALNDGVDTSKQETRDAQRAIAEYVKTLTGIPDNVKTAIITRLDKGAVDEVTTWLSKLQNGVIVPLVPRGVVVGPHDNPGPAAPSGSARMAGAVTNITIHTAADPNAVVNAIQQYNRNNGPAPIKVQ